MFLLKYTNLFKKQNMISKKRNRIGNYFCVIKEKQIYKCPYENCNRSFKEKGNMNTHIRIHVILFNLLVSRILINFFIN